MSDQSAESVEEFFAPLDVSYRNIEKANEPIIFQTKDSLIKWKFELPIPTTPGSLVKYRFTTTIGDISFGAKFFDKQDSTPEVLIEECRVPSDVEPITGSFKSRREGTLILYFDNSFSWLNPKLLTYKVALFQPAFAVADEARSLKSQTLLRSIITDIRSQENQLAVTQERFLEIQDEVAAIEEKIVLLEEELANRKKLIMTMVDQAQVLHEDIEMKYIKRNGLFIRLLTKPLLVLILSYLGGTQSSTCIVSKYWYLCSQEADKWLINIAHTSTSEKTLKLTVSPHITPTLPITTKDETNTTISNEEQQQSHDLNGNPQEHS